VPFLFKLENFNEKILEKFKKIIKENGNIHKEMYNNDEESFFINCLNRLAELNQHWVLIKPGMEWNTVYSN
jgi:hypothetical protein